MPMAPFPPIRLELPPCPASARDARHFVGSALAPVAPDEVTELAVLLTSELVTNAVLYAGGPIEVEVRPGRTTVRVAVADHDERVPVPRRPDADAISGRGLGMVEALAENWGIDLRDGVGKAVWFELPTAR